MYILVLVQLEIEVCVYRFFFFWLLCCTSLFSLAAISTLVMEVVQNLLENSDLDPFSRHFAAACCTIFSKGEDKLK